MKRTIFLCALPLACAAAMAGQQSNPYEGTSNPPPDDTITTPVPQAAPKPSPAHRVTAQPASAAQAQADAAPQPTSVDPNANYPAPGDLDGTDGGIVQVAPEAGTQPGLNQRAAMADPDGDIVHPAPLPPGTLREGATIRARLLERLSTAYNQDGDAFRAKVASDVFQGNDVLIPVGAEIDGKIVHVSTGHLGGHGSMVLRPERVVLPDGSKFRLYAQVTGAPGARAHIGDEGAVTPGSRLKKDSIEYGGGAGVGAVAGASLGGPAGALAGTIVGASAVTVHLLMDHPQATLETGTVLLFTLTERLHLEREAASPARSDTPAGSQNLETIPE